MPESTSWTLLVYRIPTQPTRLRLAIWRRLQKMGVLYLQDAVCLLPDRPDLTENMHYVAQAIEEIGGICHLFSATALRPNSTEEILDGFRDLADQRLNEIFGRLETLEQTLVNADSNRAIEQAEEELKRERVAYLHARKLFYVEARGGREADVEQRLERLETALEEQYGARGK